MRTPWRVGKYDDRCNGYEILSAGNAKIAVALYMGGTGAAKNCAELIVDRVNAFETDATIATLRAEVARLAKMLGECATRFESCCIHSGSDKEFAASAVADYRAAISAAKAGEP